MTPADPTDGRAHQVSQGRGCGQAAGVADCPCSTLGKPAQARHGPVPHTGSYHLTWCCLRVLELSHGSKSDNAKSQKRLVWNQISPHLPEFGGRGPEPPHAEAQRAPREQHVSVSGALSTGCLYVQARKQTALHGPTRRPNAARTGLQPTGLREARALRPTGLPAGSEGRPRAPWVPAPSSAPASRGGLPQEGPQIPASVWEDRGPPMHPAARNHGPSGTGPLSAAHTASSLAGWDRATVTSCVFY